MLHIKLNTDGPISLHWQLWHAGWPDDDGDDDQLVAFGRKKIN
jgi:hypothetical protein